MTKNMKKLLELASADEELKKRLETATKGTLITLAKEKEIELTEADFTAEAELSEDELDAVAGGGKCLCTLGGGGTRGDKSDPCACVMGGAGMHSDGDARCVCVAFGEGYGKS